MIVLPWKRYWDQLENSNSLASAREEGFREAARIYEKELERVIKEDLPKMCEQYGAIAPVPHLGKIWNEFEKPTEHLPMKIPPIGFQVILYPPEHLREK